MTTTRTPTTDENDGEEPRIEDILMDTYYFRTMDYTREIYYYDESKGIYLSLYRLSFG